MHNGRFPTRILTLFLALSFALPSRPAMALRQTGVEESEPVKKELISALAGAEEQGKQSRDFLPKLTRRQALAVITGMATFTGYTVLSRQTPRPYDPRYFLSLRQIPERWRILFDTRPGVPKVPYFDVTEHFAFWTETNSGVTHSDGFDLQGRLLGTADRPHALSDKQQILDPRTGERIGFYRTSVFRGVESGISLYDRYGRIYVEGTLNPFDRNNRPLPGAEGTPLPRDRRRGDPKPLFEIVSRDPQTRAPTAVHLIGYIRPHGNRHSILLDSLRRPMAQLEPVGTVVGRQNPQTLETPILALTSLQSLNQRFFGSRPSPPLLAELDRALERFRPDHPRGRIAKLLLAHRRVQMQVLLGRRQVRIDPEEAGRVLRELLEQQATLPDRLEAGNPQSIRLMWRVLANSHPWYAVAVEAARDLGWQEDPALLAYALSQLQQTWISAQPDGGRRRAADGTFDRMTSQRLRDLLEFNSLRTLEEVNGFFRQNYRYRSILPTIPFSAVSPWDEVLHDSFAPISFMDSLASDSISKFQWLLLQASVLERAGYQTKMVSLAPRMDPLVVNEETKHFSREWILLVRDKADVQRWFGVGSREDLRVLGREPLRNGMVQLTQREMEDFLQRSPQNVLFQMTPLPTTAWDARVTLEAHEQAVQASLPANGPSFSPEPVGGLLGWNRQAASRLFDPLRRTLEAEWVDAMVQRFDQIALELGIRVQADADLPPEELSLHKASLALAIGLIPRKFLEGIRVVRLARALSAEYDHIQVVDGVEIRIPGNHPASGFYAPHSREVATISGVQTPVHEFAHHWDLFVTTARQAWYGNLSLLYYGISWERDREDRSWRRRPGQVQLQNFFESTHALVNEREDIAEAAEYYVFGGRSFRQAAQRGMDNSRDFTLAAKYLFVKYLMFLDRDGRSIVHELGPGERDLTFETVLESMDRIGMGAPLPPEIQRLRNLISEMQRIWTEQRRTRRFVQNEATANPVHAAGAEEQGVGSRMPEWLGSVTTPEEFFDSIYRVHDLAIMTERIAVLVQPELVGKPGEHAGSAAVRLMSLEGSLHSLFGWSDQIKLRVDPWSEQAERTYLSQGYRVVRVIRDGEDHMRDPIPEELMLLALSQAVASGQERFAINVTHYLKLRGLTFEEIRSQLTDLYA